MNNFYHKYHNIRSIPLLLLTLISFFLTGCDKFIVLQSKGAIGKEESNLIIIAFLLMLIVVIPVIVLTFWFLFKYKAGNKKSKYTPDWSGSTRIEWFIWAVPLGIVLILSYLTWTKTSQLDPYKPIEHANDPVQIEVISLDWKWLFIYPEYDIATVNQLVFPENTPLEFRLTSASVMTSFFIPQLGSQMYAMAGMETHLNLIASDTATLTGQNQEFSGVGYESMFFEAKSVTTDEFKAWIKNVQQSPLKLDLKTFKNLEKPSDNSSVKLFTDVEPGLFNQLIKKFMKNEKMKPPDNGSDNAIEAKNSSNN
ncbi:ubiquinol oxidase subunit II [Saccharicrinis sp. FJH2]|uniref:ubiquinol oxidase subunit II n=1 Tax=Saccharicrinis sp. FJH65 TaxID=3344659 RepID=UPI0035F37F05